MKIKRQKINFCFLIFENSSMLISIISTVQRLHSVSRQEWLYFPASSLLLDPQPWLSASNFSLPVLAPNLYLSALAYNFITSPGPEFAYTNIVSSICICIYGPDLRFILPVRGLNLYLHYYWQQQQWQQEQYQQ